MIKDLRLVEIELFSYCNRMCSWCPNRDIDRHSNNHILDDDVLIGVLNELKDNGYSGHITFSRYNEPLSHHTLLKDKLRIIKEILRENKLITNTNGDFLTNDVLDNLLIDELTVMDYDNIGVENCIIRLNSVDAFILEQNENYIYAVRGNMKILYILDWVGKNVITDRGGILLDYSKTERANPCFEPLYFIGINYDGTISPCCNIRNDSEKTRPYIMGDLNSETLSDILSSRKMLDFQKNCSKGLYLPDSPCFTCENSGGRYTRDGGDIFYE